MMTMTSMTTMVTMRPPLSGKSGMATIRMALTMVRSSIDSTPKATPVRHGAGSGTSRTTRATTAPTAPTAASARTSPKRRMRRLDPKVDDEAPRSDSTMTLLIVTRIKARTVPASAPSSVSR